MFILKFLNADKQRKATKRPKIKRRTVKINQAIYFCNALTLKKQKTYFLNGNQKCFREMLLICFHKKQKAVDSLLVNMNLF